MPSSYYTHATGKPANQTRGLASEVRYELDSIAASFDLLPSPTALASGSINYALDTGLTNAYVVSVSSAVTAYSDGFSFFFKPLHNNSGASTLNVNTLGLKAIVRPDGTAVQLNDIVANQILKLTYNSSYNGFQLDTDISYANQAAASASAAAASAGSAAASAAATAGAIVTERSATATLTNKTLAAPVITGGSSISGNVSVAGSVSATVASSINQLILERTGSLTGKWGIYTHSNSLFFNDNVASAERMVIDAGGNLLPGANDWQEFGSTSLRWSQVWCTAGAFNTSDATLKTPIRTMQAKELAAGYQMAQELGTFQWIDSVKEKGDKARRHVGLTVQRAAEIMESHGLKPWSYGFMGYDKWAAVTEIVDATEDDDGAYQEQVTRQKTEKQASQKQTVEIVNGKPVLKVETVESDVPITEQIQVVDADGKPVFIDVPEVPAVLDEEGNEATPAIPAHQVPMMHAVPVMETVQVWKRVKEVRPAGESYAFRSDQLAFFIAAGVAAKVGA